MIEVIVAGAEGRMGQRIISLASGVKRGQANKFAFFDTIFD